MSQLRSDSWTLLANIQKYKPMDECESRVAELQESLDQMEKDRDYWRDTAIRVLQEINDAKAEILKLSTGKS